MSIVFIEFFLCCVFVSAFCVVGMELMPLGYPSMAKTLLLSKKSQWTAGKTWRLGFFLLVVICHHLSSSNSKVPKSLSQACCLPILGLIQVQFNCTLLG
jgi:hypothetical protein